ncbi:MAG: alpha/beta fold hydrolase [Candidatus Thermoplasmatota archaeon]
MKQPGPIERRLVGAFVRRVFWGNRRGKPWDVPAHLEHDSVRFAGNSGATLAGRYFPHPAPKGVVVLAHPDRRYGSHWFVREGWVEWLLRNGFEVLTFDFAPFGASRGGSTYLHEDVLGAVAFARRWSGGQPVHVIGLSIGAFATVNASPHLDVDSLVLESPYPTFNAWYGRGWGKWAMALFDRLFPRTANVIQAHRNIANARAPRILVAASPTDDVTPARLSRIVFDAAPARARWLDVPGTKHLGLFADAGYRAAVLATLEGRPTDREALRPVLPTPDAR